MASDDMAGNGKAGSSTMKNNITKNSTTNHDPAHMKYLIIGLGLIGGSLAKALKEKAGADCIYAADNDREALKAALAEGVITGVVELPESIEEIDKIDIIFICTPVNTCMEYLDAISKHIRDTDQLSKKHKSSFPLVTDVCSTKKSIIDKISSLGKYAPRFVGGHPMTGSEREGYLSSESHLFENAYYIITPSSTSTPETCALVKAIVHSIGAIPIELDAEEHDHVTAGISHLPHVLAAALVNLVKDADVRGIMQLLAAGGFKDLTRIASSNPDMWKSIVNSNKRQIIIVLDKLVKILADFRVDAADGNLDAIGKFFMDAREFRDSLPVSGKALIPPEYHIVADIADKPGIIGRIASILGSGGINIKNINVSNNREMEQGCLRITLSDLGSVESSLKLLTDAGYKVYKV